MPNWTEKIENERLKLRKFCIDTPANRAFSIANIDDAPMNGIPIIKHLLEEVENLKKRVVELEKGGR